MQDTDVQATVTALEQLAGDGELSPESVRAVVTAATRLYARASDRAGQPLPPLAPDVSATEALTLACALLKSQDLTPFDMAIWCSRGQGTGHV
jgi:hypothetical protein